MKKITFPQVHHVVVDGIEVGSIYQNKAWKTWVLQFTPESGLFFKGGNHDSLEAAKAEAKRVIRVDTRLTEAKQTKAATAIGKRGGEARAKKLTPEKRTAIARWHKR